MPYKNRNFILKSTSNKSSGLEIIDNPVYKRINEGIKSVEIDFHIRPNVRFGLNFYQTAIISHIFPPKVCFPR